VASIIERINFDCPINLMLAIISLTAPWNHIPTASRVSYGTEPTPGTVISDVYAYEKPSKRERFAVLKCNMLFIDLVQLGGRHRRAGYSCKSGWMGEWLAP
jgi:pyridoxamine 5'-phosphate oxidase